MLWRVSQGTYLPVELSASRLGVFIKEPAKEENIIKFCTATKAISSRNFLHLLLLEISIRAITMHLTYRQPTIQLLVLDRLP